ncbi:MAG: hypothetical protein R6U27_16910 [Desulfobacterales bacterium]
MEIVIGKTARMQFDNRPEHVTKNDKDLPVRILHMRPARSRKKSSRQGNDRRNINSTLDPVNAKVLVLLVPDGHNLPPDLSNGNYQLRLRIIPEKNKPADSKPATSSENGFSRRV